MLLVLLYHRINADKYSNRLDIFSAHLRFLAKRYNIVLPGDRLPAGRLSVCITFDDAYFDFYHYVFPLLRELKIKAVLGVPVKYIMESTSLDFRTRLSVPHDDAMADGVYENRAPFCTWTELSEMVASGFVEVASHSLSHKDLTGQGVDLQEEIVGSKGILEHKVPQKVTTFVYPFGKMNRNVHSMVTGHYSCAMRIGSAFNRDWDNSRRLIYRVNADYLPGPGYPFKKTHMTGYLFKYIVNVIRGR